MLEIQLAWGTGAALMYCFLCWKVKPLDDPRDPLSAFFTVVILSIFWPIPLAALILDQIP